MFLNILIKKNYKKINWNTQIQVLNKKKQLLTLIINIITILYKKTN